jgi:hypothetical protein
MKRLVLIILAAALLVGVSACEGKGDKYTVEITTLESLSKLLDKLRADIDATNNRTTFGKSIIDFIGDFKLLKGELDKIQQRWPGVLTTTGVENPPEELKPYFKNVSDAFARMRMVLDGKHAKFGGNEDANKIVRELKEVMYYY